MILVFELLVIKQRLLTLASSFFSPLFLPLSLCFSLSFFLILKLFDKPQVNRELNKDLAKSHEDKNLIFMCMYIWLRFCVCVCVRVWKSVYNLWCQFQQCQQFFSCRVFQWTLVLSWDCTSILIDFKNSPFSAFVS